MPLRMICRRSRGTPSSANSSAEGRDTVTHVFFRCSHGEILDSISQPNRDSTGPATDHCSRWQWCVSTTVGAPATTEAKKGTPFWVSTMTSGQPKSLNGPNGNPNRAASSATNARG